VFGDLAEIGYDAEWGIVSAFDVGAPHLRQRIFIVAYPLDTRRGKEPIIFTERFYSSLPRHDGEEGSLEDSRCLAGEEGSEVEDIISGFAEEGDSCGQFARPGNLGDSRYLASSDTKMSGFLRTKQLENNQEGERGRGRPHSFEVCEVLGETQFSYTEREGLLSEHIPKTGQATRCSGFGQQWAVEPSVGRVADGVPNRVDRLRCLGNAVVPQVAEVVGKAIIEADSKVR
jgi:DNA (cytosine-5)-methyltransferase 1